MSSNANKTAYTEGLRARSTAIIVCLTLMLGFASIGYGDIIVGNFENADSNGGWGPGSNDANAILVSDCNIGVTLGHGSLKLIPGNGGKGAYWRVAWQGTPLDLTDANLQFDLTMIQSEWSSGSFWTQVGDEIAINSGGPSGWKEYGHSSSSLLAYSCIDRDTGLPTDLWWGTWESDANKTYSYDVSDYDSTGSGWMQIAISVQVPDEAYDDNGVYIGGGNFYFDNIRLVTPSMVISKCTVSAGGTQYMGDGDYNDMKDSFTASGTIVPPADVNDINSVAVTITSVTDGNVIYTETLTDFDANVVNSKHKYTHSGKLVKGQEGKITSLTLDFRQGKFAITAKNVDLTGLSCPFELKITVGSSELKGRATEAVVNGPKKLIPTRLMRLYKDTLVVDKAKAKHNSKKASSDTLSVAGDIAVADMDLDTSEPNLVTEDVVLTWGDINGTPTKTLTIPGNASPALASFKASKTGHVYKCSKIHPTEDPNSLVAAQFDLDKCAFTVSVSKASDVFAGPADANFGVSFDTFSKTADVNHVTGRSW